MAVKKTTRTKKAPTRKAAAQSSPVAHVQAIASKPLATNNVLILLLVAASLLAGYFFSQVQQLKKGQTTAGTTTDQAAQPQQTTVDIKTIKDLFSDGYLKFGDANRKVLFVEISDPSCPYCHVAGGFNPEVAKETGAVYKSQGGSYTPPVPEMKKLVDQGQASFVMLFGNGHGNGRLAAEALYCAYDQNKFWEAHDLLMSNDGYNLQNNDVKNDRALTSKLVDFLASTVDSAQLTDCLQSKKHEADLTRDEKMDAALGFNGTPHFFVNNQALFGAQDWDKFQPLVDAAQK